ncbi:large ribosomal subunit protein bL34c [Nicotiana tomentosiformis]|uniref:large ribosomal subunit protein bL34c n=1 Tax=Nicotiana tomentosiformis TaxID=4098 RepID=UPI00388C75D4
MASLSMVCSGIGRHVPSASLSLLTGSSRTGSVSLKMAPCAAKGSTRSGLLHCSFVPSSALSSLSASSSFSGKDKLIINFILFAELGLVEIGDFSCRLDWFEIGMLMKILNRTVSFMVKLGLFKGSSLGFGFNSNIGVSTTKRRGLVVRAKKYALCQTKRNRSRKSLARTHGFRKRMSTTSGRAVIKRRRAKGRWELAPKSSPRTGKRA